MLEPKDLEQIRGIVQEVVDGRIAASEERVLQAVDDKIQVSSTAIIDHVDAKIDHAKHEIIDQVDDKIRGVVLTSEDRIVARINREITDLAEINQAVLNRFDHVPELQPARR